eukprot:TRINITY_DN38919_c0_g1_i1.p1 TRINITY_DN38919_c0_g1~~TRINITY_DN38919_c0_g1_i1.p1  ORF type:complete len:279 (+),score=65.71 TRINITY_DN38919_c0_g1_i1:78-839(+)
MAGGPCALVRRRVPNDCGCLFTAIAYLADPEHEGRADGAVAAALREAVARAIAADPATYTDALLGMPNTAYQDWIRDPFSWGGGVELAVLARHYGVAITVGSPGPGGGALHTVAGSGDCGRRILLLYTGSHYDPVVGVAEEDSPVTEETRIFHTADGAEAVDAQLCDLAAALGADHAATARAVRCLGCGALCRDAQAFQAHCGEVQHGEDFAFECEEVAREDILIDGDDDDDDETATTATPAATTTTTTAAPA